MLPRAFVHDYFAHDPADRSCGEEGCTKRLIGRERIGNFEDAGFGLLAIRFRRLVFFYLPAQLPRRGIDLPCRDQNLKLINSCYGLLDVFPCARRVVLSHRYTRLQNPRECLQVRIGDRQRGLKKTVSCAACIHDVSGQEPGIARFEVCGHSPDPMQEKFCGHLKVLYVPEMFKCLRVFPFMERHVSSGDLVNCVVLSVWILSPRITARLTNSPCTLEVESQGAKPCFAEGK